MKSLTMIWKLLLVVCLSFALAACGGDNNDGLPPTPEVATASALNGGLVWDNWTKLDAGGTGTLPAGAVNKDFVRCKACHGWDTKGLDGGYVRRSAKDTRPNPEFAGDLTTATANLSLAAIDNATGRAFSTEDKHMPKYNVADGLTDQQTNDVLEFLVNGPKVGDFADIDTNENPVAYTFTSADTSNGATLYANNCKSCHGEAASVTQQGSSPALGAYFVGDGKYSEGFHKAYYGVPGSTSMTRTNMGSLSGAEVADILAYVQSRLNLPGDAIAGGLAWDNWTKADAGGTGALPAGAVNKDFVRCKACHGWDTKGLNGGYVRRSAKDTRPNPEFAGDLTAADAKLTLASFYNTTGRAFSVEDKNMPAFDTTDGLTDTQADNLLKFLVSGPKIGDYATIDPNANPVAYTFTSADTANGETLYANKCAGCHGAATSTDETATTPALGAYFAGDGKYSEGFHKAYYGVPGSTSMTRTNMGSLSGTEVADILAYVQQELNAGSTPALDGATLFSSCTGCHGADGVTGFAPDINTKTAAQLQAAPSSQSAHATANAWSTAEAQAVVDYLAAQ